MNEPSFIHETAQLISDVKGLDLEEAIFTIAKGADSFFSFSKVE
jgi:Tat protein secretion system quality control protein TatD with DNase activity